MKTVLVISYYWPPAGGPGAIRLAKFAKYLPEFGWQPLVLTVKKGEFPYRDTSLHREVRQIPVFRTPAPDPFRFYKKITGKKAGEALPVGLLIRPKNGLLERIAGAVRANVFIPDARIGWVPFAIRRARQLAEKYPIELIFVSSPPHSSQL
ncbi:MAG: glycosyl transferase family 1, partial [Calditrichia bacterium]